VKECLRSKAGIGNIVTQRKTQRPRYSPQQIIQSFSESTMTTLFSKDNIIFEPNAVSHVKYLSRIIDYGLIIINAGDTKGKLLFVDNILKAIVNHLCSCFGRNNKLSRHEIKKFCLKVFNNVSVTIKLLPCAENAFTQTSPADRSIAFNGRWINSAELECKDKLDATEFEEPAFDRCNIQLLFGTIQFLRGIIRCLSTKILDFCSGTRYQFPPPMRLGTRMLGKDVFIGDLANAFEDLLFHCGRMQMSHN
jgi:hypothetical protein